MAITLYHSVRIPDDDNEFEASEFRLTATLVISGRACSVETVVDAHLEREFGQVAPGAYTLFRTEDFDLDLDSALGVLRRRVEEMCGMHDAPERLGFSRES
ncbi:hypothetical protein [Actinacidiphila glaucinigra]|uniref:hypothetical protein n=1 Tax=Actinacidiphila glaucinigra TaxID=235986 RepID=UPI003D8BC899